MERYNLGRITGLSAYEIAVKNGFEGTEQEWLEYMKASDEQVKEAVNDYLEEHPEVAGGTAGAITGSGKPTTSTKGEVGQLYMNTDNGDMYKCVGIDGTTYTWELLVPPVEIDTENLVLTTPQELTADQMKQARANIGAVEGEVLIGKNLIDETKIVVGEVPASTGAIQTIGSFLRTDYILLKPGTYTYSNKNKSYNNFRYALYDINDKSFMKFVQKTVTFTITEECYAVLGDLSTTKEMQLEAGTSASDYEKYITGKVFYDVSDQVSQAYFKGKTILFDGDSITAGDGFTLEEQKTIIYPALVAQQLGMKLVNHAIGGSTAASKYPESENTKRPLVLRFNEYTENADIIFIAIGTNDWAYSYTDIGTMEDREDVSDGAGGNKATPYTFYGALHMICRGFLNKYPGKTIIFATPIKRRLQESNTDPNTLKKDKTLKQYGEIIKEVCDWYSIPVVDMYSECGITPFINEQRDLYFQETSGGTHPNAFGQLIMAKRVVGAIRNIVGM